VRGLLRSLSGDGYRVICTWFCHRFSLDSFGLFNTVILYVTLSAAYYIHRISRSQLCCVDPEEGGPVADLPKESSPMIESVIVELGRVIHGGGESLNKIGHEMRDMICSMEVSDDPGAVLITHSISILEIFTEALSTYTPPTLINLKGVSDMIGWCKRVISKARTTAVRGFKWTLKHHEFMIHLLQTSLTVGTVILRAVATHGADLIPTIFNIIHYEYSLYDRYHHLIGISLQIMISSEDLKIVSFIIFPCSWLLRRCAG